MDINSYLIKIRKLQEMLLSYLEDESNNEQDFKEIMIFLTEDPFFLEDRLNLKEICNLIYFIVNDHKRNICFFDKIEKILLFLKEPILKHLNSKEIFNIFKKNKRALLFILKEHFIEIGRYFVSLIEKEFSDEMNYFEYFYPEFKNFLSDEIKSKIEENLQIDNFEDFDEKRKIGENDSYIAYCIRNDLIDDFIVYVNQTNTSLKSNIKDSIFETNQLLLNLDTSLIQYASFFGSYQIFKYLCINNVDLDSSLWIFTIHGNNPDLIHFLESNGIRLKANHFKICLQNAITNHHNNIADYIINNYLNDEITRTHFEITSLILRHYNFAFFPNDFLDPKILYELIDNDHIAIVEILLNSGIVDVNTFLI